MVPEGGTAKLICKAKGYPKPVITWRKEDDSLIIIKGVHGAKSKGITFRLPIFCSVVAKKNVALFLMKHELFSVDLVKKYEGEVLSLPKIVRSEMGGELTF